MLFKILKRDFSHKKLFVFLSTFFCGRSKGAYREWQIETSCIRHFQGRERLSGVMT